MKRKDEKRMRHLYDEWQSSGLSMKSFSKRHDISASTFSYWANKFKKPGGTAQGQGFSPIAISAPGFPGEQKAVAVLEFRSGTRLELFYPVEIDFIKALIQ
jgi:transposase-like protein